MSAGQKRTLRCAIYTRKSSEEGLEQSFNSLDAQREACQAYILSQRQEGWRALDTHYDDGGFSGGSMGRPALKHLLADIEARKIDTVVVYKVDRLTRSLADFAKIIEAFDARSVSFVSVTQQFNTTSSMGRLTLNILLSFAQFEREVTGERIRDKIAASKRKGMWMGGRVPLGYDLKDRRLVINKKEAEQVQEIFRLYLKFGCVRQLKVHLEENGIRSKVRTSRSGLKSGGTAYSRGALYKILSNRIYLGEIPHKGNSYAGEHAAIVDQEIWHAVHMKLAGNAHARRHGSNASDPSVLRGLLYSEEGTRLTPSHALKNGKRYRYYALQGTTKDHRNAHEQLCRIPAREIERLVLAKLKEFLRTPDQVVSSLAIEGDNIPLTRALLDGCKRLAQSLDEYSAARTNELLTAVAFHATVRRHGVNIQVHGDALRAHALGTQNLSESPLALGNQPPVISFDIPTCLKRAGRQMRLIILGGSNDDLNRLPVPALVKAVSRAYDWMRRIETGEYKDQRAIAKATGLNERYISHILPIAFLAPPVVEAILEGKQAAGLNLRKLVKSTRLNWSEQ